jgi:hypothetical protein
MDPGPLNSKNIFEQLNNNSCVQTGSCVYRRRKFRAGATYVWFYLNTGCIQGASGIDARFVTQI